MFLIDFAQKSYLFFLITFCFTFLNTDINFSCIPKLRNFIVLIMKSLPSYSTLMCYFPQFGILPVKICHREFPGEDMS